MLEDHPDIPALFLKFFTGHLGLTVFKEGRPRDFNRPSGGQLQEVDGPHQSGFPRPGITNDPIDIALFDFDGHVGDRVKIAKGY